jgi:hypothetical protein
MNAFRFDGPIFGPPLASLHSALRRRTRPVVRTALYAIPFAVLTGATAVGIHAFVASPASLMSRADYQEARRPLEADARIALARCRALQGTPADVCKAQARGEDRIRKAEVEVRYLGTTAAVSQVRQARAQASYHVARAKCGGLLGEDRLACLGAARTGRARALADDAPPAT